jgi:general stress protein CsbA
LHGLLLATLQKDCEVCAMNFPLVFFYRFRRIAVQHWFRGALSTALIFDQSAAKYFIYNPSLFLFLWMDVRNNDERWIVGLVSIKFRHDEKFENSPRD